MYIPFKFSKHHIRKLEIMLISYNLYIWTILKVLERVSLRRLLKFLLHKMQAAVISVLLILFYLLVYIKFSWCYDSFPQITLEVISVVELKNGVFSTPQAVCTVGSTLSMTVTASLHSWRFSLLAVFFIWFVFRFVFFVSKGKYVRLSGVPVYCCQAKAKVTREPIIVLAKRNKPIKTLISGHGVNRQIGAAREAENMADWQRIKPAQPIVVKNKTW